MASERSSRRARDEREGDRDQIAQTAALSTRHPVDEILPPGPMFVYGLQHVMSMYAGLVAVPLILLFNAGRRQPEEAPIFAEGPAPGLTPEYQPGGHFPHEDTFTDTHRPTDVDQGPVPPRTVSPSSKPAPPPDKEMPR